MTAVGVDLGTTGVRIAAQTPTGVDVIRSIDGTEQLDGAVSFDKDGAVLLGAAAVERSAAHPSSSSRAFKPLLGLPHNAKIARAYARARGLGVTAGPDGGAVLGFGAVRKAPQALLALLVSDLLDEAAHVLGERPTAALAGLPPSYRGLRTKALRAALVDAGLETVRLVPETVAAAAALLPLKGRESHAVIVDVGASQVSAALVHRRGNEPPAHLSVASEQVGGEDVDAAMVRFAAAALGIGELDPASWERLRQVCEGLKRELSMAPESLAMVPPLPCGFSGGQLSVTEEQLEELLGDLLAAVASCCDRCRVEATRRRCTIDTVHLVGGMSLLPAVGRRVSEALDARPKVGRHTCTAVAVGAARLAPLLRVDGPGGPVPPRKERRRYRPSTIPPPPRKEALPPRKEAPPRCGEPAARRAESPRGPSSTATARQAEDALEAARRKPDTRVEPRRAPSGPSRQPEPTREPGPPCSEPPPSAVEPAQRAPRAASRPSGLDAAFAAVDAIADEFHAEERAASPPRKRPSKRAAPRRSAAPRPSERSPAASPEPTPAPPPPDPSVAPGVRELDDVSLGALDEAAASSSIELDESPPSEGAMPPGAAAQEPAGGPPRGGAQPPPPQGAPPPGVGSWPAQHQGMPPYPGAAPPGASPPGGGAPYYAPYPPGYPYAPGPPGGYYPPYGYPPAPGGAPAAPYYGGYGPPGYPPPGAMSQGYPGAPCGGPAAPLGPGGAPSEGVALEPLVLTRGLINNPLDAEAMLALPMARPLTQADLAEVALPVLLLFLGSNAEYSGTLEVTAKPDIRVRVPVVQGKTYLKRKDRAAVVEAFSRESGQYFFDPEPPKVVRGKPSLAIHVVIEGLRTAMRAFEAKTVVAALGPRFELAPVVGPERRSVVEKLGLTDVETRIVLSGFDGERSGRDVVAHAGTYRRTTLNVMLLLTLFDLVEYVEAERPGERPLGEVLRERAGRMVGVDHFEALALHWSATGEEAKEAHQRLMTELAPGGTLDSAAPDACQTMRERVDQAFAVLGDDGQRQTYRRDTFPTLNIRAAIEVLRRKAEAVSLKGDAVELEAVKARIRELAPPKKKRRG